MQENFEIEKKLKQNLNCGVDFGRAARALYATDSSNYRQVPIGVVTPESKENILRTVEICRASQTPVLLRGGGTALAGQTTNVAVVLDTSKHYNRILAVDAAKKTMRVQPGIVLDEVRKVARRQGLTFGPDPATHSRCTLGGMIGNNSCGVHSVMAGKTVDNIESLEILTYDGVHIEVGPTSDEEYQKILKEGGRRAEIYRRLRNLRDRYQKLIREKYPNIPRRVSGYNLDQLLPENGFNVARALVGSEGTCVTVLEATLRLVKNPEKRVLAVVAFKTLAEAGHAVTRILPTGPVGLEGIDDFLARNMEIKNIHPESVHGLPEGNAWLLAEYGGDTQAEALAQAQALQAIVPHLPGYSDIKILTSEEEQQKLWTVRESGLGATAFVPGQQDTWEGWEDSAVPPEKVGDYLRDLRKLYDKYNYKGSFYGHFGQGCIHTRINFELKTREGIEKYDRFLSEAVDLVVHYGGSISGEHGDGQSKAKYLGKMFGPELIEAFNEFKDIWDPSNRLNPRKVVHPYSNTENLRLGTEYAPPAPKTYFQFPQDQGSFARAALRCVGVGLCRRHEGGVMCPSYKVTREEKHATRGRAHLLFEMLRGEVIHAGWRSPEVKEALDLCLACKGCKGECPTNVDMATYKAEFLAHYYHSHLRPRVAYSMGQIRFFARLARHIPRIVNFFTQTPGFSFVAKKIAGIHPQRRIPRFAAKTFHQSQTSPDKAETSSQKRVLLWADTFSDHFHPTVAQAAYDFLSKQGFEVLLSPSKVCCGRPLYDFGFLRQARRQLKSILKQTRPLIREGVPFVFLEPSCCAVFREELKNFFPHDMDAFRLSQQSLMLSEFLIKNQEQIQWPKIAAKVAVQGHCHHRSVLDFEKEKQVLTKMGLEYDIFDEGCCGMAGAFGFEEKHYEISQAVGQGLFKKLKDLTPDTLVLANGFSCHEQIHQHSGRRVYHLAEILNWPAAKERPCKTKLSEKPSGPSAKVTSPRRAPETAAK